MPPLHELMRRQVSFKITQDVFSTENLFYYALYILYTRATEEDAHIR